MSKGWNSKDDVRLLTSFGTSDHWEVSQTVKRGLSRRDMSFHFGCPGGWRSRGTVAWDELFSDQKTNTIFEQDKSFIPDIPCLKYMIYKL